MGAETATVQNRKTGFLQHNFHCIFIHTQAGSKHVAADKGQVERFQISLQRAVFNIGAVHNRKSNVNLADNIFAQSFQRISDHIVFIFVVDQNYAPAFADQCLEVAVLVDVPQPGTGIKFIFLAQIKRNDFIFVGIHVVHGLNGRNNGNFMLGAFAAENNRNSRFHDFKSLF